MKRINAPQTITARGYKGYVISVFKVGKQFGVTVQGAGADIRGRNMFRTISEAIADGQRIIDRIAKTDDR